MKIWTCGSSPRSGSRNAWTRIKNVNGASRLSNFWNFFGAIRKIYCRDWWPWEKPGYSTMTRRQSNNHWSGGIVAHPAPPQNSVCKIPLYNFSPQFFWDQDGILPLITLENKFKFFFVSVMNMLLIYLFASMKLEREYKKNYLALVVKLCYNFGISRNRLKCYTERWSK